MLARMLGSRGSKAPRLPVALLICSGLNATHVSPTVSAFKYLRARRMRMPSCPSRSYCSRKARTSLQVQRSTNLTNALAEITLGFWIER